MKQQKEKQKYYGLCCHEYEKQKDEKTIFLLDKNLYLRKDWQRAFQQKKQKV